MNSTFSRFCIHRAESPIVAASGCPSTSFSPAPSAAVSRFRASKILRLGLTASTSSHATRTSISWRWRRKKQLVPKQRSAGEPLRVHGEPRMLRRMIRNSAGQRKALRGRRHAVEVDVGRSAGGESTIASDPIQGPVFPPRNVERIFEPFYRPPSARTQSDSGCGARARARPPNCRAP